ncbi:hypothetical protein QXB71_004047 [Vibrio cholerae]|uniref:AbiTii domain-containing protein n=1 Tax=Vibrio cholerae TaxID=666 RepID=UPI0001540121|nr:hypothetical protein [Vibrio cholerae]EGR1072261.1 hypothetical protein [Vibrio cholerae]EKG0013113.1 hypothetical protein [Vibrio cholerae]ELJ8587018.1 hypothetical protein [Vibrio cholerae]ELO1828764.1 hypothetical protein [Vibrio cholerae]KNH52186.1 hypothetical protein A59_4049 [Vibrio cholerae 623-39]
MSLLREIQNSAIDANEPIGTLLRKCKVLAARLGSSEFKRWVENELNGYTDKEQIPEYRIMSVGCKGYFSGGFGTSMSNASIPSRCIPENFREGLFTSYLSQPISSIESLINDSDGGTVQEPWPADVTAHFGMNIYQGMNCLQAWKVIPVNALVGILDMIRSRVLNFVLEIESEDPEAGDAPINSQPVAEEKVQQIFHTYITGNVQNVATGSSHVSQHALNNENTQLFNELLQALSETKGHDIAKEQIMGTVEEMRDSQGSNGFKENYHKFISVLADHMQVFGPVVAPFLPTLATLMP